MNKNGKVKEDCLNNFIEDACSELLKSNENAADLQGGLLDSINRCTKKELFCGECCGSQFGFD